MRCVRPDLTTVRHCRALLASDSCSTSSAGIRCRTAASVAAMWVAVGKVSLELCDMLTSIVGMDGLRRWRLGDGGDDLVGVHVRAGTRPSLKDVDGELVVVLARPRSRLAAAMIASAFSPCQQTEVLVHLRASALEQPEGTNLSCAPTAGRRSGSSRRPVGSAPATARRLGYAHLTHRGRVRCGTRIRRPCRLDNVVGGHLAPCSSRSV